MVSTLAGCRSEPYSFEVVYCTVAFSFDSASSGITKQSTESSDEVRKTESNANFSLVRRQISNGRSRNDDDAARKEAIYDTDGNETVDFMGERKHAEGDDACDGKRK